MKRNGFETLIGALVIIGAALFFQYSYKTGEVGTADNGYDLVAEFSGIGGLRAGDDVRISGVKVGSVKAVSLNPQTYLAEVTLTLNSAVKVPTDTAAAISSESLMGGLYMGLEPGAEEDMLAAGDKIEYTQAPQNLEQLLGQFIFSMQDKKEETEAAQ